MSLRTPALLAALGSPPGAAAGQVRPATPGGALRVAELWLEAHARFENRSPRIR